MITVRSGTVCRARDQFGKGERQMFGIRFLTAVYTLVFVVLVLVFIGSIFGAFQNPMIDPGL
jgi:uncharacterized membrane protein